MLRKTLNASRLQEQVHRRLHRLQEVVEDGVKIGVPRPLWQAPDRSGCNWTMQHFGNAAGFEASIERVLKQVQDEYNLTSADESAADDTEAQAETKEEARDPFGGTKRAAAANPFGDAKPTAKVDPFGETKTLANPDAGDFGKVTPGKRPVNPFGD